jgi:hypothetical protein
MQARDKKIDQMERELSNAKNLNNNLIIKATRVHNDDARV